MVRSMVLTTELRTPNPMTTGELHWIWWWRMIALLPRILEKLPESRRESIGRLINDPPVATLQNVVGPSTSLRGDIIVVTAATSTVPSTADSPFPSTKTRDSILMAYPRELATPATGTIKNGTLSAALGESTAATAIKMTDRRKIFLLHGLYQAETLAGSPRASLAEIQSRMWAACPRTGHGARFEPLTDTEAFFFTPRLRDGGCLHPVCGRGVYCCNNVGRSGRSMLLLSAPVDRWQGVCRCMRISRRGWPTLAGGWESHQPCPSFFMTVRLITTTTIYTTPIDIWGGGILRPLPLGRLQGFTELAWYLALLVVVPAFCAFVRTGGATVEHSAASFSGRNGMEST